MEGTVTKFSQSKAGKPTIYIDEKLYFVGKCKLDGLNVGDRISFEAHAFSDDGKLWGLDKWGKLPNGNVQPTFTQAYPDAKSLARVESWPVHNTPTGSSGEPARTDPAISNWIAHAIQAGLIKDPEDIEKWVSAARNALKGQS